MSTANEHEEDTPGWLQLLLFPLMLIAYICQLFAGQAEQTKAQRRTGIRSDWQDFIQDLYDAEWPIIAMKAEGARRILAGEDLNLDKLAIWSPGPEDVWLSPTSAQQMHLRMLGLSRFHVDPEFFIRRHARRILREAKRAATTPQQQSNPDRPAASASARTTTTLTTTRTPARAGMRVRAPPWRPNSLLPAPHFPLSRRDRERRRTCAPIVLAPVRVPRA